MGEDRTCALTAALPHEAVLRLEGPGGPTALRITLAGEHTWRLQTGTADGFDRMGAAQVLARDLGEPLPQAELPFAAEETDARILLRAAGAAIAVHKAPFALRVTTLGGQPVEIDDIRREAASVAVCGRLAAGEAVFGTGERFNCANQRGKLVDVYAIDRWCQTEGNSYAPVPFIHTSRGYGMLLNRYERAELDLGATDADRFCLRQHQAPLDLYLFAAAGPAQVLAAYSDLTGHAPAPAPWNYGVLVCRHLRLREFAGVAGIRAMADSMAESGFHWDAVILEGWEAFDASTYGELKKAVELVHGMGKKVLVYSECGRLPPQEDPARQAAIEADLGFRPEYFVREPDGNTRLRETDANNPADMPNPRRSQFVDLTNPEAMAWWFDFIWGRLVKTLGIDGSKIDFCEQFPDGFPLRMHDGRGEAGAHHWYPTLYNSRMWRYFNSHSPGGMCFSRGGGIGAQRYPFLWAGDQLREFRFLRAILTGLLSCGLSGMPFVGHDLAGYLPAGDAAGNPERTVFLRGVQLACFTLNMQTHGTVTRPYDFDPPVRAVYRAYTDLHMALVPYLQEQAVAACSGGMPVMRHLYLHAPHDAAARGVEDEYMLGQGLLVAPELDGRLRRDIYLPEGDWTDLFTGARHRGGQTLAGYPVPLAGIPVFVLQGHGSPALAALLPGLRPHLDALAGVAL